MFETLNGLISGIGLGDAHGTLMQKIFYYDSMATFAVGGLLIILVATGTIIKLKNKKSKTTNN